MIIKYIYVIPDTATAKVALTDAYGGTIQTVSTKVGNTPISSGNNPDAFKITEGLDLEGLWSCDLRTYASAGSATVERCLRLSLGTPAGLTTLSKQHELQTAATMGGLLGFGFDWPDLQAVVTTLTQSNVANVLANVMSRMHALPDLNVQGIAGQDRTYWNPADALDEARAYTGPAHAATYLAGLDRVPHDRYPYWIEQSIPTNIAIEQLSQNQSSFYYGANSDRFVALKQWLVRRCLLVGYEAVDWRDRFAQELRERLVLFLHNLWTTSGQSHMPAAWTLQQHRTWRQALTGNLPDVLRRVSYDRAMLLYLNNSENISVGATWQGNENYARELLELFTLGVGNGYTEADIKAIAQAFAGFGIIDVDVDKNSVKGKATTYFDDERRRQFSAGSNHLTPRTIFGETAAFIGLKGAAYGNATEGAKDVISVLFERLGPAVARYLSRRLWDEFLGTPPSDAQINALAAVLVAHQYQIAPWLTAFFTGSAVVGAISVPAQRRHKILHPLVHLVGIYRRSGLARGLYAKRNDPEYAQTVLDLRHRIMALCNASGFDVFNPPNVKGHAGNAAWLTTQSYVQRTSAMLDLVLANMFAAKTKTPLSSSLYDERTLRMLLHGGGCTRLMNGRFTSTAAADILTDPLMNVV